MVLLKLRWYVALEDALWKESAVMDQRWNGIEFTKSFHITA